MLSQVKDNYNQNCHTLTLTIKVLRTKKIDMYTHKQ